jgi:ribosomal protein S5
MQNNSAAHFRAMQTVLNAASGSDDCDGGVSTPQIQCKVQSLKCMLQDKSLGESGILVTGAMQEVQDAIGMKDVAMQ